MTGNSWGKIFFIFVGKLTSTKFSPTKTYLTACNAVQAMKSNEIFNRELNEFYEMYSGTEEIDLVMHSLVLYIASVCLQDLHCIFSVYSAVVCLYFVLGL